MSILNKKLATAALAGLLTAGVMTAGAAFAEHDGKGSCNGKDKAAHDANKCKGEKGKEAASCKGKDGKDAAACQGKDKPAEGEKAKEAEGHK